MFNLVRFFKFLNNKDDCDNKISVAWVNLYENGQMFGYRTLYQAKKRKSAISRVKVEFKEGHFDE